MSALILAAWTLLALGIAFGGLYGIARAIDNYGIVDIAWSYAFGAVAFAYAFFGTGWQIRRALIAALAVTWSLRLGTHLLVRIAHHHPEEDGRYRQLRKDWAGRFVPMMAGFFQLQAASVVALSVPFLASAENASSHLSALEEAAIVLWLVAVTGESLADRQLARFKADPSNKGQVCDRGLWRYSRHPNYFFEWLIWVSYALFASASPWGWIGWVSPACILFLLLRVTGIPMTEDQSVRSKGDLYRRYQARTSVFVPWFPRA